MEILEVRTKKADVMFHDKDKKEYHPITFTIEQRAELLNGWLQDGNFSEMNDCIKQKEELQTLRQFKKEYDARMAGDTN